MICCKLKRHQVMFIAIVKNKRKRFTQIHEENGWVLQSFCHDFPLDALHFHHRIVGIVEVVGDRNIWKADPFPKMGVS